MHDFWPTLVAHFPSADEVIDDMKRGLNCSTDAALGLPDRQ